jgi:hypothetical protein
MSSSITEQIKDFSVHLIDNESSTTYKVNIVSTDFHDFTRKLFFQELSATNKRYYKFSRDTNEVAQIITNLIENCDGDNFVSIFEAKTDLLAEKLLEAQQKTIERHPNIQPPKKGNLVVIFSKKEDKIEILISKIDQAMFLNLQNSKYTAGLPEEKATQKSCCIIYKLQDDEYQLENIIVSDTNSKIATFWVDDFLQLKELTSNESNTVNAFNGVENVISSYIKKKSKGDYVELRNNLVGYFRTKNSFKLDEMIEYVIGDYSPESDDINIETLKERLKLLPEKKDFDTSFEIIESRIKARYKRSYKVSDKIELRTSDYIENLKDVIVAKEDDYGEKVLIIKHINEEIYNSFKTEED